MTKSWILLTIGCLVYSVYSCCFLACFLCSAISVCSLTLCIKFCTVGYVADWYPIPFVSGSIRSGLLCPGCFPSGNDFLLPTSLRLFSQISLLL